jgi:major capsid protein 13
MATVQLSNVYNPLVFAQSAQEKQIELNRFIQSGVAVVDPTLQGMATVGGNIGELPFYLPLGTTEPNYSTDNPAQNSTPLNISSAKMIYRLASQNQSWSVMDISRELALADPVGAITTRIGQYWATNNERRIIQSVRGLIADNIANDGGDMVFDISAATDTAVTDANRADADAIIDTVQTMGDHGELLSAIAMHSVVYRRLQKQNLIDFIPDARGEVNIPTYQGKTVIVDDSLVGVTYGTTPVNTYYYTILFGAGEFIMGEGRVNMPSEFKRNPDAGNGGGEERLYSRRADIIHPVGFQFTSSSVAGQSATQAELATAANWNRVYNRKNVSLAVLKSNG